MKTRLTVRFLAAGLLSLACCTTVEADIIHFQEVPDGDVGYQTVATRLRASTPTLNFEGEALQIGATAGTQATAFRGLLGFDLSAIPAGSTINSVTLTMTMRGEDSGSSVEDFFDFELHEITGTGAIVESEATWNDRAAGVPWTTPGGDFSATVLSSISVQADGSPGDIYASQPEFVFIDLCARNLTRAG